MVKIGCDWCQKDIKGRPDRYANHHFCLNDDCKNKYRRFIEGKIQLECRAVAISLRSRQANYYEGGPRTDHSQMI